MLPLAAAVLLASCSAAGTGQGDGTPADTASSAAAAPSAPARPVQEGSDGGSQVPSSSFATSSATAGAGPECAVVRCTSVVMTGDLLLHEALWEQAAEDAEETGQGPLDFGPILSAQQPYVDTSDLALCHVETPVAEAGGPYAAYPSFNAPPQILDAIAELGYDACTTASNHTIDRGTAGLERTLDALDEAGLEHTGSYRTRAEAEEVLIMDTPAARVAVIEATYALNGLVPDQPWQVDMLDADAMIAKAKQAREEGADIVLGAVHAGDEYTNHANAQQQDVAHKLADSGEFSLIYGHHSHSVQPIEKYKDTWIVYGLGNAIAAHATPNILNTEGLMVRAQFSQNDDGGPWDVSRLAWLPVTFDGPEHRWCPVAADALEEEPACVSAEADAASRERTKDTVESMGAAEDGAQEWLLSGK
ncbi:CapA family protein [Arthrobacter sp. VKM Ac-2550]|uniref:CapA family protein n=1 Tax=Crystallibacter permensis TaxID=1938888 RepID=UPI0022278C28|nr:CapA family protein [Arthrobacter sp. VKM Ac-2550]